MTYYIIATVVVLCAIFFYKRFLSRPKKEIEAKEHNLFCLFPIPRKNEAKEAASESFWKAAKDRANKLRNNKKVQKYINDFNE